MQSAETKRRLLEAALAMISGKGYLGATTKEIAKEAGVTEITLFRHFGSKERLFEEMLKAHTFLPRIRELLPRLEGMVYPEALAVIGTRFLETLKERKALFKIMNTEAHLYPGKIKATYGKFIHDIVQALAEYFKTLQGQKKLRSFPPERGAEVFLGMLVSYFRNEEIVHGRTISRKEMEERVLDYVDLFAFGTAGEKRRSRSLPPEKNGTARGLKNRGPL